MMCLWDVKQPYVGCRKISSHLSHLTSLSLVTSVSCHFCLLTSLNLGSLSSEISYSALLSLSDPFSSLLISSHLLSSLLIPLLTAPYLFKSLQISSFLFSALLRSSQLFCSKHMRQPPLRSHRIRFASSETSLSLQS